MNKNVEELYKEREKRIQAAINLEVPDKVPVICSEDAFSWSYAGISMREFMLDNEKMMMAREMFYRDFQPDTAYVPPAPMDPMTIIVGLIRKDYRNMFMLLKGKLDIFGNITKMLKKRKKLQSTRLVPNSEIRRWFM